MSASDFGAMIGFPLGVLPALADACDEAGGADRAPLELEPALGLVLGLVPLPPVLRFFAFDDGAAAGEPPPLMLPPPPPCPPPPPEPESLRTECPRGFRR